jgi:hypothetical protein
MRLRNVADGKGFNLDIGSTESHTTAVARRDLAIETKGSQDRDR